MTLAVTGVALYSSDCFGEHTFQFRRGLALNKLIREERLGESEEDLLNPEQMSLAFRWGDETWACPSVVGNVAITDETDGRVLFGPFTFLDKHCAALCFEVDSAVHAIIQCREALVAFELRPVPVKNVLAGIELSAKLLEVLAVENLEDIRPANRAELVLSPVLKFGKLFRVRCGAARQQAVEGGHHVVTRRWMHLGDLAGRL